MDTTEFKDDECPHCKFLYETFTNVDESTNRDYYLMTETFVYLHGGDVCNWKKETAAMGISNPS